jgi:hypothetical protein
MAEGFNGVVVWRRDAMTDSFGEGYSTRSDEEGFGGVYGQNEHAFSRKHHGKYPLLLTFKIFHQ